MIDHTLSEGKTHQNSFPNAKMLGQQRSPDSEMTYETHTKTDLPAFDNL